MMLSVTQRQSRSAAGHQPHKAPLHTHCAQTSATSTPSRPPNGARLVSKALTRTCAELALQGSPDRRLVQRPTVQQAHSPHEPDICRDQPGPIGRVRLPHLLTDDSRFILLTTYSRARIPRDHLVSTLLPQEGSS